MSRAMDLNELGSLLRHIRDHHSPLYSGGGQIIKYVEPVIDMRATVCFTIRFRRFGGAEHVITTVNEAREIPECLYDRCMDWLDSRE